MKLPNRIITGLGILMISASPLLQAAPPDQRGNGPDDNRGGHQQGPRDNDGPGNRGNGKGTGPASHDNRRGPPQDFGPVRETFQQHRDVIGRGQPLPPGIHIAKGRPLPPGYGKRLDPRSLQLLPHYDGYEWRRLGTDVVLIAVGSGIVYAILDGVLN
ncbi:anti-virulence regulator CigR family protein [Pseudomonas alliivorans]|nr:anti-virulence regulator CigR family protein [Pseudomonas alliivorans]MEE4834481.1 anti-virulence regulator CigR family protein [Pseudomonas alliivorans]MEE4896820.1 anti-virulence regulator CigR family protein [Pseudomonas alliivorans]MEE4925761.1 anti-virulence regulator CigR family protein [Pseudomonas alliivorans]MEE5084370.1 anti-virulence regulator CigR family protein [Pseudomonas alliivorans]